MKKRARSGGKHSLANLGGSQTGFGAFMGFSYGKGAVAKFTQRNNKSTSSISTYNPFKAALEDTGADQV